MPVIGKAQARTGSPIPRRSRIESDPGFNVSPQSLSRGNVARSISRTRTPARASVSAAMLPAGPAPITRTSASRVPPESWRARFTARVPARGRCSSIRSPGSCTAPRRRRPSRGVFGMKSISQAGSGSSRLIVGGSTPSRHGQRGRDHAGGAARALRMTDHRLRGRSGHRVGVTAEDATDALGLDAIVQLRRGTVVVDVADLFRTPVGATQRGLDAADDLHAIGIHLHAMIGVAGRCVAFDAGVDGGTAGARALLPLEHQHPRAFAEHEPVAPTIEGPRRRGGTIVVARRDGAHAREAEDHARQHAAIGAARQDDVVVTRPNQGRGVADRVGRARAPAREHVTHPAQPQRDRDLTRHHPADADGDRVRRHVSAAGREEILVLLLADVDASAAAADQHAGARLALRAVPRRARLRARQRRRTARRANSASDRRAPRDRHRHRARERRQSTWVGPMQRPDRDTLRRRTA